MIGFVIQVPMLIAHWRAILAAYLVVTLTRAVVTSGLAAVLPPDLRIPPAVDRDSRVGRTAGRAVDGSRPEHSRIVSTAGSAHHDDVRRRHPLDSGAGRHRWTSVAMARTHQAVANARGLRRDAHGPARLALRAPRARLAPAISS